MPPGQGTGFVSVGDYLDANQGTLANETNQINSGIGGEIDSAKSAADSLIGQDNNPGTYKQDYTSLGGYGDALDKAIKAKTDASAIQTHGGLADYFKTSFKDSQPQADFDANLLGGNRFAGLSDRANGLTDYLNGGLGSVKAPPPAHQGPFPFDPSQPFGPTNGPPEPQDDPAVNPATGKPYPTPYQRGVHPQDVPPGFTGQPHGGNGRAF